MTKALDKTIIKRSELQTKYSNNSILENRSKYKNQKTFCGKLYKKEGFYLFLILSDINDIETFWKTMKYLLSDNSWKYSGITLVDTDKINSDNHKLANTFNTFFKNAVGNLSIKENFYSMAVKSATLQDIVDICTSRYRDHPSIKFIW